MALGECLRRAHQVCGARKRSVYLAYLTDILSEGYADCVQGFRRVAAAGFRVVGLTVGREPRAVKIPPSFHSLTSLPWRRG